MSDISPSKITTDAEFEKQIANADFETIKVLMADRAVALGVVQRDIFDPSVLIETEAATQPQPRKFARVVRINAQQHIVEAENELALEKAVGDLYRAQPAATTQQPQQVRNQLGQFTTTNQTADGAAAEAELRLRIIRGETTVDQAVGEYLASQGVPIDELKSQAQEHQSERFVGSWAASTEAFKTRHPEWETNYMSEENHNVIGNLIVENNLTDSDDKLAALEAAYNHARQNGLLVENPEVALTRRINEATDPYTLRSVLQLGCSRFEP